MNMVRGVGGGYSTVLVLTCNYYTPQLNLSDIDRYQRKFKRRRGTQGEVKRSLPDAAARTQLCLRHVFGLSDFNVENIEKASDKLFPSSSRKQNCISRRAGCCYSLLWWYWQAMKRNHVLLSPFMTPYVAQRRDARSNESHTCVCDVKLSCLVWYLRVRPL